MVVVVILLQHFVPDYTSLHHVLILLISVYAVNKKVLLWSKTHVDNRPW